MNQLAAIINRARWIALTVGLLAVAATAIGAFTDRRQFFFSYLFAFVFWTGLSLGCLLLAMIHQLTGGRWGYVTRRFLEAGFLVLPVMLLLFVPLCFGLRDLYPWARSGDVAVEKALQDRHAYMNPAFFVARQVAFFAILIWIGLRLRRHSLAQDQTSDAAPTQAARMISGPGIVAFGLVGTFAVMDWVMSLETHWYSSLFAVIVMIGQIVAAFSFVVLMLSLCAPHAPFAGKVTRTHYHHLGNFLLTFVLFWTYVSFGQLLIVYSGDLPHELEWYRHRIAGGWKHLIGAIALLHFFVPFFLLLFRMIKKDARALTMLAGLLFVMHLLAVYWLIMPALHPEDPVVSWMDFTATIGMGGVWLSVALWHLRSAPWLPQNDPGMQFAFVYAR